MNKHEKALITCLELFLSMPHKMEACVEVAEAQNAARAIIASCKAHGEHAMNQSPLPWHEDSIAIDDAENSTVCIISSRPEFSANRILILKAVNSHETLSRIAMAASSLEEFLGSNAGSTADWPIEMCARDNDEESATRLARLLTELANALKPYRKSLPA